MFILRKIARSAAISLAVVFVAVSLLGSYSVWCAAHWAGDTAAKVFGGVKTAAGAVQSGAERVAGLVGACRTELRKATETVTALDQRPETIGPALSALGERVETRLEPRIAQAQQALAAAHDALRTMETTIDLLGTLQIMDGRPPEMPRLEAMLDRLQELSAEATQLRATLKTLAEAQAADLRAGALSRLSMQIERIDAGLDAILSGARDAQVRLSRFQDALDAQLARTRFCIGVVALLAILLLAWNVYAQLLVIRCHWRGDQPQVRNTNSAAAQ